MTLYELTGQWLQLQELAQDPDVDWDVFEDTLEGLEGTIEDKAVGYAKVIRGMEADNDAIDEEIKRLQKRKTTASNAIDRMKTALQTAMELTNKPKIKTELFSFTIRNNPPKVVLDVPEADVPPAYLIPQPPKVDKGKLKDDLKHGAVLDGIAHLEQGQSLQIK